MGTALVLLARPAAKKTRSVNLLVPTLLVMVYAALYPFVPRLVQAGCAVAALGCTMSAIRWGTLFHFPLLGLSLPIVASLQFFLGYPLRMVSGFVSALLLRFAGLDVLQEGTLLKWGGSIVSIDVPCSGIRMLWAGLYLALVGSALFGLGNRKTAGALAYAGVLVIPGNGLRSATLFYKEAGLIRVPEWSHEAVGLVVFAATAVLVVLLCRRFGEEIS